MNWYKRAQYYNNQVWDLNRYLKQGFNPHDYVYYVPEFLRDQEEYHPNLLDDGEPEGDPYEAGYKWLETATPEQIAQFQKYIEGSRGMGEYGGVNAPGYEALDYQKFVKPTWLVHFTDNASGISESGFQYGHDSFEGLGLTTWKANRKQAPGYNFAFLANSREARMAAISKKYGDQAVIFVSSGVAADHSGDEERQIVFYGPSVSPENIFPIYLSKMSGDWYVPGNNTDPEGQPTVEGEFSKVVAWVIQNHGMLQNIRR